MEKSKPWRSPEYLAWVRGRACSHCHEVGFCEAHHVIGIFGGFIGGKVGDQFAVPLCRDCHQDLHDGKIELVEQVYWLGRTLDVAFSKGKLGKGWDDG